MEESGLSCIGSEGILGQKRSKLQSMQQYYKIPHFVLFLGKISFSLQKQKAWVLREGKEI